MSDYSLTLVVKTPTADRAQWKQLIEGMCNGELGAYFEERIAHFGPAAEAAAEPMLDDWYEFNTAPLFENYREDGNTLRFTIEDGSSIRERTKMLVDLFLLCGAEEAYVEGKLLEEYE